jgi:hypothetical protein
VGSTRVEKIRVGSEGGIFQNLTAGPSFRGPSSPLSSVCRALLWKGVEMAHQNDELHTVIQNRVTYKAQ